MKVMNEVCLTVMMEAYLLILLKAFGWAVQLEIFNRLVFG